MALDEDKRQHLPLLHALWIETESENMQAKWVVCSWGIDSKPNPATCFKAPGGTHGPCCFPALAELMSQRQETWKVLWSISGEGGPALSMDHPRTLGQVHIIVFLNEVICQGVCPVHSQLTGKAPMPGTWGPERSSPVPLGRCRGLQGRAGEGGAEPGPESQAVLC